jgi:DNA-directed RNA polymerase subunit RPC12/RpoP
MDKALIPIIVVAAVLAAQFFFASRCNWRCGNCGHTFSLSPLTATLMPHSFGGRKFIRCPNCGSRCWASPVPKA